ncbi:MAG: sodium:proton antiporter, partial [Candidatus Eremiobacteraeota bacterium]|nr:sodium:proton antiporter [Candidatus Eremiobacteraeota bacterium]
SGESLVNDATALTVYRFAIGAAVGGAFVASQVFTAFLFVTIFGTLIGLIVAAAADLLIDQLTQRDLADEVLTNVVILLVPFASYLPAEALGASGVMATVASAVYLGRQSGKLQPDARILGTGVWNMLLYLLNAFVFLLLGLQLHSVIASLGRASFNHLLVYGLAISLAVVALRFIWVFPASYLPRLLIPGLAKRDPAPPWQAIFMIGWSGMRGIVSLAAALALPVTVGGGVPFPARNEIVFVTFCVILVTLVGMGLSLPFVARFLGMEEDGAMAAVEIRIRIRALESALTRLHELEPTFDSETEWEVEGRIVDEYRNRIEHLTGHLDGVASPQQSSANEIDHRLQTEALSAERTTIMGLRRSGEIPDDIYHHIEYDLDLAQARLNQG